ncbi:MULTISPECIES: hypothetical protein [Frankia]|uniref:Uncharacterized protein n=1 Tax=Frankia alni (strain DSM 45986 / CECT 9034 / ACN14a) TaxID=326424 RepID=Q0RS67_FRAAA|nr:MULTISPECIES: hypothetical protein [Frankia]CAJ59598.1 hypothetical protein FRAAL0932 [Frankia alni ACN14a]
MNTNPPRTPGGTDHPNVVTFLGQLDGAAVSVGPPSGTPPTPEVVLTTQRPHRDPAVLRLAPDEADRLARLLSAAACAAAPSTPADRCGEDGGGRAAVRSHHVVCVAEGSAAEELRHALALLPARARLVDFTSDTDVVLVFATDDPRWPVPR